MRTFCELLNSVHVILGLTRGKKGGPNDLPLIFVGSGSWV